MLTDARGDSVKLTAAQDRLLNRLLFWGGLAMLALSVTLEVLGVVHDLGVILTVVSTALTILGAVRGASQESVAEVKAGLRKVEERVVDTGGRVAEVRDAQTEANRLLGSIDAKLTPAAVERGPAEP